MSAAKRNELELKLRQCARELESYDVARLWKWEVPVRIKSGKDQCPGCSRFFQTTQALFTRATGADFFGYTASGRVILIECKETKIDRLPLGEGGLKAHQFIHLADCDRANGIALLVWRRKEEVAVIGIDVIKWLTTNRKSIPWGRIPQKFVKPWDCDPKELLEPHLRCRVGV